VLESLRSAIRDLAGYVPGEQPRESGIIKLNTNESPYPPSPWALDAIRTALTGEMLRRYPDPVGTHFRHTVGRVLNLDPESVLIGNGSDDILTILTRAFVPEGGVAASPTPSYLLYSTLAALQGAMFQMVPYEPDGSLPQPWPLPDAHLTFLANPNSPTGHMVSRRQVEQLASSLRGPLIVDEAYADFAQESALDLVRSGSQQVVVTRSFSKSYSLAGIRLGFAVATPAVVRHLLKVKDSYNCDALSLAAGVAALQDQDYFRMVRAKVLVTRWRMEKDLARLGFVVTPSQANFVWCRRTDRPVKPIYEELKNRHILVRYMHYEGYGDGLRISVGTDPQIDQLMQELKRAL
jgi:histidinol-phosphate aminotransferase